MLDNAGFDAWCRRRNLTNDARLVIENIRNSEPVRRVKGRRGNVCGTYPSVKMGLSIQWESHTLELHSVYLNEHNPDVLEYYDQPSIFNLHYIVDGRKRGSTYKPDYFELRRDSAGWVEWKYEKELLQISREKPWKYVQDDEGRWRCPPAEEYAQRYGLDFHVKTEADLPRTFLRNIRFLEDFILDKDQGVDEYARFSILEIVHKDPGVKLRKLLDEAKGYNADDLYYLLVTGGLFVDLSKQAIADPHEVNVYSNEATYNAFNLITNGIEDCTPEIDVSIGQKFGWDNQVWTIIQSSDKSVTLANAANDISIPITKFAYLISNKDIVPMNDVEPKPENTSLREEIIGAGKKDLITANARYTALEAYWRGDEVNVPLRTLRDWQLKFKIAEQTVGSGYIGLLPQTRKRGNAGRKMSKRAIEFIEQAIDDWYETKKQMRVAEVWGQLDDLCRKEGIVTPSMRTFYHEVSKRPLEERIGSRQGPRARYQEQPFYFLLDKDTPRHGDRPFEIVHIDHTQLDVEAVSRRKLGLGRPWATFAVDAYTRRVLAIYITYERPSYRSCMMVFRQLIQRYNRKPSVVVVDNGKEFDSVYFDAFLNRYRIIKKKRPPHMSRFGSIGERMFGTTNTQLIHNLTGNTQIMKEVRKVSKSFNPKNMAVWTLELLWEFLSIYAYEVYDRLTHSTLGRSPREEFAFGMADAGYRKNTIVAYDDELYFNTLPTTRKGTAKVDNRYGIKINTLNYWHSTLRDSRLADKQVDIKFDPFNIGIAYAYINKQWIQLKSDYYEVFRGYSVKTIQTLSAELRKQLKLQGQNAVTNARELAEFLLQAQQQEEYLQLFEREEENKRVRELMESKAAYLESFKTDNDDPQGISEPAQRSCPDDIGLLNAGEDDDEGHETEFEDDDIELEAYEEV